MDKTRHIVDYRNRLGFMRRLARLWELVVLAAGSPGYFLLGMIIRLWALVFPGRPVESKRIVILGFGGIGNHLMLIPAINAVRKSLTDSFIHLVATSRVCADLFKDNTDINGISVMDIGNMTRWSEFIRAGRMLRTIKPDIIMAASGTRPAVGGMISFVSGARQRVGEDWKGRGAFYTQTCRADSNVSELQQNLRLAELITGEIARTVRLPALHPHPDERRRAMGKLVESGVDQDAFVVGIHPGSGKGQKWKRWDIENFIRIACRIVEFPDVRVIFFLGPDEQDLKTIIEQRRIPGTMVYFGKDSIRDTAALIGCCGFFISNDSGLRHIAVAMGVPGIGIFGPTSVTKNAGKGFGHMILQMEDVLCSPCHYTPWWLACGESRPCLRGITVERVWQAIEERI